MPSKSAAASSENFVVDWKISSENAIRDRQGALDSSSLDAGAMSSGCGGLATRWTATARRLCWDVEPTTFETGR